jgi:hypothetical protein
MKKRKVGVKKKVGVSDERKRERKKEKSKKVIKKSE